MQLAIKSDKSRFIESSVEMNHFIYELQRGIFGPLVELANVWVADDQRSEFYLKKAEDRPFKGKILPYKHREKKRTLPFQCENCRNFISTLNENRRQEHLE